MALIDRLRAVNDRLMTLPSRFGDPRYPVVVLIPPSGSPIVLTPNPMVTEVDVRMVGKFLSANVEIASDDLMVSGVSRSYDQTIISKSKYILGATLVEGIWTGRKAEVLSVDTSDLLSYKVVVRPYRSR